MNSGALLPCHALLSTNDTCAWQGEVDAEIQVLRGHSLPWKDIVPQSCHKLQWITMGLVGPGYYDTFALSRRWKHGLLSMHACERRLTFASSTLHVHLDPSMIRSFWQIHLNPAGVKIHIFHYIYIDIKTMIRIQKNMNLIIGLIIIICKTSQNIILWL